MISRCSELIVNWLINNKAIKQEDFELYYYGAYSLVITILPICLALIVGGIMGSPTNGLLLILPFALIRKYSGGYHAKSPVVCMIFSVTILTIFIWISNHVSWNSYFKLIVSVATFSLIIFSPIESVNRKLDDNEKRKLKKMTVCLLSILLTLLFLLGKLNMEEEASCFSLGIILTASLQIPCIYFQNKKNATPKGM